MPKKKARPDLSRIQADDGPFNQAFAGLAALRPDDPAPPTAGSDPELTPARSASPAAPPSDGPEAEIAAAPKLVVRKEKKGRGGKTVTRIDGFREEAAEVLPELAKILAKSLGCGAKVEGTAILLQGSQSERAAAWLRERGGRRVVIGDAPRRG